MSENKLREALQKCVNAMQKSVDIGCTDHLDAADDAGQFWYEALENAVHLLNK